MTDSRGFTDPDLQMMMTSPFMDADLAIAEENNSSFDNNYDNNYNNSFQPGLPPPPPTSQFVSPTSLPLPPPALSLPLPPPPLQIPLGDDFLPPLLPPPPPGSFGTSAPISANNSGNIYTATASVVSIPNNPPALTPTPNPIPTPFPSSAPIPTPMATATPVKQGMKPVGPNSNPVSPAPAGLSNRTSAVWGTAVRPTGPPQEQNQSTSPLSGSTGIPMTPVTPSPAVNAPPTPSSSTRRAGAAAPVSSPSRLNMLPRQMSTPPALPVLSSSSSSLNLTGSSSSSSRRPLRLGNRKKFRLPPEEEAVLMNHIMQKAQTGELTSEQRRDVKKWLKNQGDTNAPSAETIFGALQRYTKQKKNNDKMLPNKVLASFSNSPAAALTSELVDCMSTLSQHLFTVVGHYDNLIVEDTEKRDETTCKEWKTTLQQDVTKMMSLLRDVNNHFPFKSSSLDKESSTAKVLLRHEQLLASPIIGEAVDLHKSILTDRQLLFLAKKKVLEALNAEIFQLGNAVTYVLSALNALDMNKIQSLLFLIAAIRPVVDAMKFILDDMETLSFLQSVVVPPEKPNLNNINVWSEPAEKAASNVNLEEMFRPSSLNSIIIRLTTPTDHGFVTVVLKNYLNFCSVNEFWKKLYERYCTPATLDATEAQAVRQRTATLLLQWIKHESHTFDSVLLATIRQFGETRLQQDGFQNIGSRIVSELSKKLRQPTILPNAWPAKPSVYDIKGILPSKLPLQSHALDIAEQLTIIDLEIFQKIEFLELLGQKWNKSTLQVFARATVQLIGRINQIGFWVATTILLQEKLAERIEATKHFINVAQSLFTMHNFHSLMGVLAGLNMAAISRLQHTLNGLAKKHAEQLEALQNIQDPTGGFKHLREAMKQAGFTSVPYLGLALQDLTRIDEGTPNEIIVYGRDLINLTKHNLTHKAVFDLLVHQGAIQNWKLLPLEPLKTFLYELPGLSEKELHFLSLEREPRGCNVKELQ